MAGDTYQSAGFANHAIVDVIWGKPLRHRLVMRFFCHHAPEGYLEKTRGSVDYWPECDFRAGKRKPGVVGRDYRAESVVDWNCQTHLEISG